MLETLHTEAAATHTHTGGIWSLLDGDGLTLITAAFFNLVSATELATREKVEVNGGIICIHVARGESSPSDPT